MLAIFSVLNMLNILTPFDRQEASLDNSETINVHVRTKVWKGFCIIDIPISLW